LELKKYPLDFAALEKGQDFSIAELEKISGHKAESDKFRFFVLALQASIHDKRGFTCKVHADGSMRILSDTEAAKHNQKLFTWDVTSMFRRYYLNCQVDTANLSENDKRVHERNILVQSRYLGALTTTRKELARPKQAQKTLEEKK
jgi:hypothetical protein